MLRNLAQRMEQEAPRGRLSDDGSSDRSEKRWGGGLPHLLDMTTTTTGLLCWRNFHPLEWQLASLHSNRTCRFASFTRSGEFSCVRSIAQACAACDRAEALAERVNADGEIIHTRNGPKAHPQAP